MQESVYPVVISSANGFFDIVLSCMGLIVLFPIFLMIGFVVRPTSRGPVLFIQERIGLHGKKFRLYKFRIMVSDADNWRKYLTDDGIRYYQVNRKLDNDPQATKVGKFLRKTSLDELPQLINVFKGNMSLVGLRPPLLNEVAPVYAAADSTLGHQAWHDLLLAVQQQKQSEI